MKIKIFKELKQGSYLVSVSVTELTEDEKKRIEKFGPPVISLSPKFISYRGSVVGSVPIHDIDYVFSFATELQANSFVDNMKERIARGAQDLKSKTDNFSKDETIEF